MNHEALSSAPLPVPALEKLALEGGSAWPLAERRRGDEDGETVHLGGHSMTPLLVFLPGVPLVANHFHQLLQMSQ